MTIDNPRNHFAMQDAESVNLAGEVNATLFHIAGSQEGLSRNDLASSDLGPLDEWFTKLTNATT